MDTLQRGIITLIRSGLTGEKLVLPEGFDLEEAYPQLIRHQIHPLCYMGAVHCGVDKKLPVMQKLFQGYCRCLQHSEGQMKDVERICAAFDAAEIDYMPLKGCNLRELYPKPEMRLMGDADILIRLEQYERIRPIMQELGFYEKLREIKMEHDYVWESPALYLELHWQMMSENNWRFYSYFGDGWKLAKPLTKNRYELSKEDEFIYLFCHFTKHYRNGGIGFRHIVDLWVYRSAYPELKESYICAEMKKLHLSEFYQNIQHLLNVWFEGAEENAKTTFIGNFISGSGAWGKAENHAVANGARNTKAVGSVGLGRVQSVLKLAFPTLPWMKVKYPILEKAPYLLVFFWVYRGVAEIIFRRKNIKRHISKISLATTENIQDYRQALNYVGLDFPFEE